MDFVANPDKQTSQKSCKKSRLTSKIQWIEYETLIFFEENQSASRFSTNKRQEAFSNVFFNHGSHPPPSVRAPIPAAITGFRKCCA